MRRDVPTLWPENLVGIKFLVDCSIWPCTKNLAVCLWAEPARRDVMLCTCYAAHTRMSPLAVL